MRRIVGIDPGLTGGLGVLDLGDGGEVIDTTLARTPTVTVTRGRRKRTEYDVPAMRRLLTEAIDGRAPAIRGVEVVLERQQAMPTDQRRGAFSVGLGYGLWLGLIVAARAPFRVVTPAAWKRHHGLLHTDKRASRVRCAERFPALGAIRAADEGPAEALLLAAFAAGAPR